MNRFASLIARHKLIFSAVLAVLVAASCVSFSLDVTSGRVDSDLVNYLGEGFDSREGLAFLQENFSVNGDIMLAVGGREGDTDLAARMDKIAALGGVSELVWYGTLEETRGYVEDLEWLLLLLNKEISDFYDDSALRAYLKRPDGEGGYIYAVLMLIEFSPSSQEAFSLLGEVEKELDGRTFATAGMTATSRKIMRDTLKEVPYYILFAAIGMFLMLLLASDSWLEPLVILLPVAAAIVLNAGTNFMFQRVSVISLAASAVLQLTIATDFCLMINYFLKKTDGEVKPSGAPWAAAAAATVTAGAFAALYAMRYGLGADIAGVCIKAIVLSFVSAFVMVPLMRAILGKGLVKTRVKKTVCLDFSRFSRGVIRLRWVTLSVAVAAVAVACFGLSYPECSYFKIYEEAESSDLVSQVAAEMENQLIIAVPVAPQDGLSQAAFVGELEALVSVEQVVGVFPAVKLDAKLIEYGISFIDLSQIPHLDSLFRQVDDRWYTLSIAVLKDGAEAECAEADYIKIKEISGRYFSQSYRFGLLSGVHDMKTVSPADFYLILMIIACAAILLSVLTLFSFKQGLAVGMLAAAAVLLNIALEGATSRDTNFIVYLVIPAVQIGSTLNYGMLTARRYGERLRAGQNRRTSASGALSDSLRVTALSVAMIAVCALSIFFVSKNYIVKDLAMLLFRGNAIGFLLMTFVLPGILSVQKYSKKGN